MRLLAIMLDGLYASVASHGGGGTLAVARDKRILDANPEALARGVAVGMPLSEARSILTPDGRIVQWEEEPYREAQKRWLGIVAEYSDVVEPLRQHEALADLSGHPRPREAAARLEEALAKAGFSPRAGMGACRWVARLAARRGDPLGLAHTDPRGYVAALPVAGLPVEPSISRRLELLGCRTAAEVATLGVDTLRGQFGQQAHAIAQAAVGRGDAQVRALFPEDSVAARFAFERPPDTRQALDAGLGWLARGLGAALQDRDAQGRTVELFLEHENASVTRVTRPFASAIVDEEGVLNALRLMLAEDPERLVESVRARLPELKSARRVQLDIQGGRSRSDQEESVRIALAHVRGAFGDGAVRLVADIPESRRVRVRRAYQRVNGHVWG